MISAVEIIRYFRPEVGATVARFPSLADELEGLGVVSGARLAGMRAMYSQLEGAIETDLGRFNNAPEETRKFLNPDPKVSDQGAALHEHVKNLMLELYARSPELTGPAEREFEAACNQAVEILASSFERCREAGDRAARLARLFPIFEETVSRFGSEIPSRLGFRLVLPWRKGKVMPRYDARGSAEYIFREILARAGKIESSPETFVDRFRDWV